MDAVATVRSFNRFYTHRVGALGAALLDSDYSLAEVRLLYEIAHRDGPSASELAVDLGMDAGYASRLLAGLGELIEKRRDGKVQRLRLTARGKRIFAALERRAEGEVAADLARLGERARGELLDGMRRIQRALAPAPAAPALVLREPQPGDLGWVVSRHGAVYAAEYGFDQRFEALVARIVADFVADLDPARERAWIAERDGERVGSVFLVKLSKRIAKLRLLLVEPAARGLGLGRRLVDECTRFARAAGYQKIQLWTNGMLHAAIHIYRAAGYRLVAEDPASEFGNQTWELDLGAITPGPDPAPARRPAARPSPRRSAAARSAPRAVPAGAARRRARPRR